MNLKDQNFLSQLANSVNTIAKDAGLEILEVYSTEFAIERKDDKSPLTEADMRAHICICDGLSKLDCGFPVLSEESTDIDYSVRKQWQTYWLVDPLDGTREFIKRNGEFTVNIALIHEQKPIIGVVYVPVTEVSYIGIDKAGSFKIEDDTRQSINTRTTDPNQLIVAGSRSHGNERQQQFIGKFTDATILAVGSSLKFCLVAEGKVDIYPRFGPTSEWDTAAAQCIVEQAGGNVVTHDMQPLRYNTKDSLLNPEFLAIADDNVNWSEYLTGL